jgi:hypothetical protein
MTQTDPTKAIASKTHTSGPPRSINPAGSSIATIIGPKPKAPPKRLTSTKTRAPSAAAISP